MFGPDLCKAFRFVYYDCALFKAAKKGGEGLFDRIRAEDTQKEDVFWKG
jgi:hypothetical protein